MILFFPPHFSFYQPYIALPSLKAFLNKHNIQSDIVDLNIDSFHYFLSKSFLYKCNKKIESILNKYNKKSKLTKEEYIHYEQLVMASLYYPIVFSKIENAINFFHSKTEFFLNFHLYKYNEKVIRNAFVIISTAYYPTIISLSDFSMVYSTDKSSEIFSAIEDVNTNPYIEYFKNYLNRNTITEDIKLIGLSITAMSQLIPGITFAKILKDIHPSIKIVLGGVIINHLSPKIKKIPELFTLFDFIIKGEGETPLLKLIDYISGKLNIKNVPNLIFRNGNTIVENDILTTEDINKLPTPDYDGFPLKCYFSPIPILSIEPARGCYYKKCTFCNQHSIHNNKFKIRKTELVIQDIKELSAKYNSCLFNISNEGVPVKHLAEISNQIIKNDINIKWYAGARFSKQLNNTTCNILKKAGCEKLLFGLESGNERILSLMKKNIKLNEVENILLNCKNAALDIVLYLMIGFPTETEKEINNTTNFIINNLNNINKKGFVYYISVFQAMVDTPIINNIDALNYNIESNGDLTYIYPHYSDSMLDSTDREFFEQKLEEMNKKIDSFLPEQTVPQTISHYMQYKYFEEKYKKESDFCDLMQNLSDKYKLSNDISFSIVQHITNINENNILIYNLINDKFYTLNEVANSYLNFFNKPKFIDEFRNKFENNCCVDDLEDFINFVIYNKIIDNL